MEINGIYVGQISIVLGHKRMGSDGLSKVREAYSRRLPVEQTTLEFGSPIPIETLDHRVREIGEAALRDGRVAVLMLAGGISSRFRDARRLRGEVQVGPLTRRSLFQLHIERIRALENRYGHRIPLFIMTSQEVHSRTVAVFQKNQFFGMSCEKIFFFPQESLPVIDGSGCPAQQDDGTWITCPSGHGAMLDALREHSALQIMRCLGTDLLHVFQYPNVLEKICDPEFVGAHIVGGFEATVRGCPESNDEEKVGRIVAPRGRGDQIRIVEYHLITPGSKDALKLLRCPANLGSYIWSTSFLERCIEQEVCLDSHILPYRALPQGEALWKAEKFLFDLLPFTKSSGYYQVDRMAHYAVIKNASGPDSLITARARLSAQYLNWLAEAGALIKNPHAQIEIGSLYALDATELRNKIPTNLVVDHDLILI